MVTAYALPFCALDSPAEKGPCKDYCCCFWTGGGGGAYQLCLVFFLVKEVGGSDELFGFPVRSNTAFSLLTNLSKNWDIKNQL